MNTPKDYLKFTDHNSNEMEIGLESMTSDTMTFTREGVQSLFNHFGIEMQVWSPGEEE